jgi:IS4 transposase
MILSDVFERYVKKAPVSVMARTLMEVALAPEDLDALFDQHADRQYTRSLLFSTMVDLMGVVVSKSRPSIHAAFHEVKETLPVSLTAVYDKLNGLEPAITRALVRHSVDRLAGVIVAMKGQLPALVPGYQTRIIDGNHLAATERRLKVLHRSKAGPLPGHSLVVLDPELMLATDVIPCEDGHAQERSLSNQILQLVKARDVWIADRNFCTTTLLYGIAEQQAFFVIRHHANLTLEPIEPLKKRGRTETGEVYEQMVAVTNSDGEVLKLRRVVVRLDAPTRDGDKEMAILTNLPKGVADATRVSELYRKRWTLETMFQSLTQMLAGEIDTLGYPRAALFGFSVALATYNVLSTVQAALRAKFGIEKIQQEVSAFYIALEVQASHQGMEIVFDPEVWEPFAKMTHKALGKEILGWAAHVKLSKYPRHPRGPKKPVPKRTRFVDKMHVSTARLLAKSRKKSP